MRTKVCLAITKGVWGGAQEYVYTLATSLPKETYDVFVVCGEGNTLQSKLAEKNIKAYTIKTLKRDIFFLNEIKSFFALRYVLTKERPDILHLNSSKMGFMGGLVGRLLGIKKIIFTAHGWASNEKRFSFLSRKIFWLIHWWTIILCHKTIAVSEKTKKDALCMPFAGHKIVVIHNGVGNIDFLDRAVARQKLQEITRLAEHTEIIIGTISELHRNKDLDLLIDSCRNLPHNTSVYIIGEGEEREHLEELIDGFDLGHKVFLAGRIPDARKYLKAFDIFTLTSKTEALPYSILEAGLAGLPVVATKVGGISEVIEDRKNGILIHRDIGGLEKILHKLIENEDLRTSLGKALHETISKEFSVEQMLRKTEEIYFK
ncbi:MAG: glycosyltransferase [bacterium]